MSRCSRTTGCVSRALATLRELERRARPGGRSRSSARLIDERQQQGDLDPAGRLDLGIAYAETGDVHRCSRRPRTRGVPLP